MPELPEVETVANGVNERIRGEKILQVEVSSKPEPFKKPAAQMAQWLQGRTILGVRRVGKHIVCDLSTAPAGAKDRVAQWIVHLGMTGRLLVSQPDVDRPPHTHAVLTLSSARELRFVDPRRFGRLDYIDSSIALDSPATAKGKTRPDVAALGFRGPGLEPLDATDSEFSALLKGRQTSIKAALLNQKLLHGVGNIYADESLFRAGIRPRARAGRLTARQRQLLLLSLKQVLREAISLGGSSVNDYVDAAGAAGFFQLQHRVYGRGGKPCLVCGTPILKIVEAGRGTHYCPLCQK